MLQLIEVKENEFFYYKQDPPNPVAAGPYYLMRGGKMTDLQKKSFSPIAASSSAVKFAWLLPPERWIKVYFDSFVPPENSLYGQVDTANKESQAAIAEALQVEEATVAKAREWQRTFVADGLVAIKRTGQYRRAAVAPLGAGKTLAGLLCTRLGGTALVLAPKYLHGEWQSEAVKWGFKPPVCSTYESAYKHMGKQPDVLIEDEVLGVKNPLAKRTRETRMLAERAKVVIGFTGTPTSVDPSDLMWLNCIYPGCVPSKENNWKFLWGKDTALVEVAPDRKVYVTNNWNMDAISAFTQPYMYTVNIESIKSELPEISFRRIYVRQPSQYDAILAGAATEGSAHKAIAQARQCSDGFVENDLHEVIEFDDAKLNVIKEFIETTGEACVVFANWNHSVDKLHAAFSAYNPAILRGGADYTSEVARFKSGATKLLIANSRIAEGMNLQEVCRIIIFMSNCSSPVKRQQAIGRVYRPGQKNAVIILDVVAENTLDETTLNLLDNHKAETDSFVVAALMAEFQRQVNGRAA